MLLRVTLPNTQHSDKAPKWAIVLLRLFTRYWFGHEIEAGTELAIKLLYYDSELGRTKRKQRG